MEKNGNLARKVIKRIVSAALLALVCAFVAPKEVQAQAPVLTPVRGVYTPGFYATNSGVSPEPGLTYMNVFMDHSFSQAKNSSGQDLGSGSWAVI